MAENTDQRSQVARQTAYIVGLDEVDSSEYIVSEGEWDPNYLLIRGFKVSRVSIIGVIIAVEHEAEKIRSFTIDDGRSSIVVRVFESEKIPSLEIGDIVLVIGRPRIFNGEKYLVPEIVKEIKDAGWIEVRKKDLERLAGKDIIKKTPKKEEEVIQEPQKSYDKTDENMVVEEIASEEEMSEADEIISLIRKFDFGNGADIEELIKHSKSKNAEKLIMSLLAEGEIFEIKAGRVKVLE
jgi:RPA family protein